MSQDFLLTALDGDLKIANGDFVIGNSDDQNEYDLFVSSMGTWKQFPFIGIGIENYQNGDVNIPALKSIITTALKNDGFSFYKNPQITIGTDSQLKIITNTNPKP